MGSLSVFAVVMTAVLAGMALGMKLDGRPEKKRLSASKLIAFGVLAVDASCAYIVLYLCCLSIKLQFGGSLPYLTTLIGALQAATGYVLGHYFKKSAAENRRGGIVYDSAMNGDL